MGDRAAIDGKGKKPKAEIILDPIEVMGKVEKPDVAVVIPRNGDHLKLLKDGRGYLIEKK